MGIEYGIVSGDPVIAPGDFGRPPPLPADVGFWESLSGPAFREDNFIRNSFNGNIATPEEIAASERVDPWGLIEGTKYEARWDSFAALNTAIEVARMKEKLDREDSDAELLAEAGWKGMAASMVASVLDLPSLIPGGAAVGAIRGGKTAFQIGRRTALYAGAEATAVEMFLQSQQETRTGVESASAIGGSVILGGMIGTALGAVLARSPGSPEAFQALAKEIDAKTTDRFTGDLSAAARIQPEITDFDLPTSAAQALKDTTPSGLSYTNRGANSRSPVARHVFSQLLQNEYAYAGTERLQLQPAVDLFASIAEDKARIQIGRVFKDGYAAYRKAPGDVPPLSRSEFGEHVAAAMRRGDVDPDYPAVSAAAKELRTVVDGFKDRAIEMGLLPKDVTTETAISYFSRMWDQNRIIARSDEFLSRAEEYFFNGLRSGAYRDLDVAQREVSGLSTELRNLTDEALDTAPDISEFLSQEGTIAARAAELRRELGAIGKRPLGKEITARGGIDPGGSAAAELRSLGVTPKTSPGLFKKGGLRDVDNLVADDFGELADVVGRDRDFLSRQGVLDALADEAAGRRRLGSAQADELAELEELLDIGRGKIAPENRAARQRAKQIRDKLLKAEETARAAAIAADYSEEEMRLFAREAAEDVYRTLARVDSDPLSQLQVEIGVKRGPLAERVFNVKDEDWEDFLINDAEFVLGRYARVMAADTELTRRFGRADMRDQIKEVSADFDKLRDAAKTEKERLSIEKERGKVLKGLKAARDQVRGVYMAADKGSGTYRAIQGMQTFNYVRALGDVVRSSLPDMFRPAMVHGIGSFMREGVGPLIRSAGRARASQRELSDAAGIAEVMLNSRMMRLADITDPYAQRTPVESTLNWMGAKASLFSGILHWNQFMKEINLYMVSRRIQRMNPANLAQNDARMLQRLKLTRANLGKIQKAMAEHSQTIEGVTEYNLEQWPEDAARLFEAAIRADTETVIVTPGIGDKVPLAEEKWWLKPGLQFKQFALASHRKTLGVGLQEDQARFASNAALMVSMGMFVYWLKAQSLSKDTLSDNPGTWLAEGIDRSGLVPVYMEVNNMWERMGGPGVYYGLGAALGDTPQRATRYQVRGAVGSALGPTFGLLTDAVQVASAGLKGDFTPGDIGAARRLVPFGNIPGIKEYLNLWAVPRLKEAVE